MIVAPQNPESRFISIDFSADSLVAAEKIANVHSERADVFNLSFAAESFDHIFVCFLLEHLNGVMEALRSLKRVLRRVGTITVIEGDHGLAYYHPRSADAQAAIQCLINVQASMGGNSLIGRELYPLLVAAGFEDVAVSPRMVYADAGHPGMVGGFTRKAFIAMVEGVKEQAIAQGLIGVGEWSRGIADLYRTSACDGTFCYTFFKATARKL